MLVLQRYNLVIEYQGVAPHELNIFLWNSSLVIVNSINTKFVDMIRSDYKRPLFHQTGQRLPLSYRTSQADPAPGIVLRVDLCIIYFDTNKFITSWKIRIRRRILSRLWKYGFMLGNHSIGYFYYDDCRRNVFRHLLQLYSIYRWYCIYLFCRLVLL